MKSIIIRLYLLLVGIFLSLSGYAYDFASRSVLASGTWKKIYVKESGICKLTYDQLSKMGFANPSEVRVFGYGGATLNEDMSVAKTDDLNEVPLYAGSNYFLFYAQGPNAWYYSGNASLPYNFKSNPYSFYGYYFLTDNVGTKKRIEEKAAETFDIPTVEIRNYLDRRYMKKEEFNYISSGKTWFGNRINNDGSSSHSFSFGSVDTTKEASIYVKCAASSNRLSHISISAKAGYNTTSTAMEIPFSAGHVIATEKESYLKLQPTGGNFSVTISYSGNNTTDYASIERIVVNAYKPLDMKGNNCMYFRNPECYGYSYQYRFAIANCSSNIQVWDVTNSQEPTVVKTTLVGDSLVFTDCYSPAPKEYVALNVQNPTFISAEYVGAVSNQNIHGIKKADLVIITHPNFYQGAEELASLHEEYDNMDVVILTPEQIYNEYSSGTPDPTAIRWCMRKLYEDQNKKAFSLMLLGDGCFDNKGILTASGTKVNNYIITYQGGSSVDESATYATDDYFCFLEDNDIMNGKLQSATMDISVGRIPCNTMEQLNGVINKIKNHLENKNYGKWKNKVLLLADDNEASTSYQKFCQYSDNLAIKAHKFNPAMEVKKVYLDAYTRTTGSNGSRYHDVEEILKEEIGKGVMIFNYVGHSSKIGFSAEHVFTQNQAGSIFNENCGFWFTASCEFSQYDGLDHSGGEDLLLNPNGGALVLISSARVVYDNKNDNLNQAFFSNLFLKDSLHMPERIGEVLRKSKVGLANDSNKLSFNLFGDPALRIHYPNNWVTTDSITEIGGTEKDTIKALSEMRVYGHIADKDSALISNFNGTLFVTLYDKEVTLYTKANIYSDEADIIKNRHEYKDRPNILFSGQVEVINGKYSFSFKVPKDINYSYGSGRFAYYAYDEENDIEAQGAYEDFQIGGSSNKFSKDEEGPSISLYMNTEKFHSGDKVNTSPVFFAKVSDENGINASGCGIGHDITLTLNGTNTPIVLNNYFSYAKGSYKEGLVAYQLNNLEEGTYTLTFKVWDLLNNSSTQSIQFTVDSKLKIEVEDLIVYPNPAKESVTLRVIHDQPQTVQSFRFLLYNTNGHIVYESEEIESKNDGTLSWSWDLHTSNGRRVAPGCYIGRAEIKVDGEKYVGESKKIIVLPQ